MPTQNRRVATYLPSYIDEPFKAFKSLRDIKGDSEALIAILSEYLGVAQEEAHRLGHQLVTIKQFEELTLELESLRELIARTRMDLLFGGLLSGSNNELIPIPSLEQFEAPLSEPLIKSELQLLEHLEKEKSEPSSGLQGNLLISHDLPLQPVQSEVVSNLESASKSNSLTPLNGRQLSGRLGVHKDSAAKIRQSHKGDSKHFSDWSQAKDPDGIAWEYHEDDKLFHPVQSVNPSQGRGA
jgi:hypothetical protein